jgi:hypothetical protein
MSYYPFWAALILLSLCASVGGFSWAYRNRQFEDQERARYLPLRGESVASSPTTKSRGPTTEGIVLVAIVGLVLASLLVTAVVVYLKTGGGQ